MYIYSPAVTDITYVEKFSAAKVDSFQCDLKEQYSCHKKIPILNKHMK